MTGLMPSEDLDGMSTGNGRYIKEARTLFDLFATTTPNSVHKI